VRGGGGGKARAGARGGHRVPTHPLSRFVTLRAPSAPCPVLVICSCHSSEAWQHEVVPCTKISVLRVCRARRAPPSPLRSRVGRTALMTMPFGYVEIEHVSIRLTAHHARALLGSWRTWSRRLVHVETYFMPTHVRHLPSLLPAPAEWRVGRTVLMSMPFGYVGDGCVITLFTAPRACVSVGS
jgi:hypothetical protein